MYSADEKDKLNLYARTSQGEGNGEIQGDIPSMFKHLQEFPYLCTFYFCEGIPSKGHTSPRAGVSRGAAAAHRGASALYCWRPHLSNGVLVSIVSWA